MAIIEPIDESRISIQQLPGFAPSDQSIQVSMLRLDRIHPLISGNKWYKLKYNISDALASGKKSILSFGGAYSNHLIATAASAHQYGLHSIAFVRGEEHEKKLNSVLQSCREYGMRLHFLSREAYTKKEDPDFLYQLALRFPDAFIIPEGGANESGRSGAGAIAALINDEFTHVLLSVGSGTTFEGLRNALSVRQILMGFVPMKGGIYMEEKIAPLLLPAQNDHWSLTDRFHFGGIGKISEELLQFMNEFERRYGFALDRVYTAKMMLGVQQLLREGAFPKSASLLCIHTGGLTGN